MEREEKKKRKRVENKEKRTVKEEQGEEEAAVVVAPPPTEAEVDEFFAILKRMQVAMRYFEKKSAQGNNPCQSSGKEEEKITASEGGVNGVKVGGKKAAHGGLDLNTIPEPETGL